MLPEELECPYCGSLLQLELKERKSKRFACPSCKNKINMTKNFDHDSLVTIYLPQKEEERLTILSLLSQADIPAFSKNSGVQDLFGFGRLGTGYNFITGPVEIQVIESEAERAKNIIEEYLKEDRRILIDELPEKCPACGAQTNKFTECPGCGLTLG